MCSILSHSGAQTLMSGSTPVLGCSTGAVTPAGINLSGILPSGSVIPSALPAAVQPTAQSGQYKSQPWLHGDGSDYGDA